MGRPEQVIQLNKKEPGRNDPCPCGKKKKYKKCCMIAKQDFGAEELLKCLYILIRTIGKNEQTVFGKGGLKFSRKDIDALPVNWKPDLMIQINEEKVLLALKSQIESKTDLILPESRIIT